MDQTLETGLFTRQCDGSKEQLPFCSLLDVSVVDNTGDDSSREYAIWECDLYFLQLTETKQDAHVLTKS